eukprot:1160844-Pelagomonas_calceolata.AAC.2
MEKCRHRNGSVQAVQMLPTSTKGKRLPGAGALCIPSTKARKKRLLLPGQQGSGGLQEGPCDVHQFTFTSQIK